MNKIHRYGYECIQAQNVYTHTCIYIDTCVCIIHKQAAFQHVNLHQHVYTYPCTSVHVLIHFCSFHVKYKCMYTHTYALPDISNVVKRIYSYEFPVKPTNPGDSVKFWSCCHYFYTLISSADFAQLFRIFTSADSLSIPSSDIQFGNFTKA